MAQVALVVAVLLFVVYIYSQFSYSRKRLPPGPPPIPLLGNIHQLPAKYQEKTFAQWGQTYGDIIYARFFTRSTVVLNSVQSARDLLDKRSAKYSGRPHSVLQEELYGWDRFIVYLDYGDLWRKHRRWIHASFSDRNTLLSWQAIQRREVAVLLSSLIASPSDLETHIKRYTSALIMETVYGHTVRSADDEYVHIMNEAMTRSVEGEGASASLVDFIPILKYIPAWMPGAHFKRNAIEVRAIVRDAWSRPYNMVKKRLASGTAKPSVVASLIETSSREGTLEQDEYDIMATGSALYGRKYEFYSKVLTMSRDKDIYPEPEVFRPERYMNIDPAAAEYADPLSYTFGFVTSTSRPCAVIA
ncbi:cytochrome P450 [Wolfiporia cocos MD-104 SS10]|uniref:Cytochrome P450 n=1 Tax=Wolfiporia cocos (strain MD-104) TaxID=742152 RepID=A0A2H3JM74_WOLCO|nr:cytochrome P450 [Wolfiporia cocos MD-104 SS10]